MCIGHASWSNSLHAVFCVQKMQVGRVTSIIGNTEYLPLAFCAHWQMAQSKATKHIVILVVVRDSNCQS